MESKAEETEEKVRIGLFSAANDCQDDNCRNMGMWLQMLLAFKRCNFGISIQREHRIVLREYTCLFIGVRDNTIWCASKKF